MMVQLIVETGNGMHVSLTILFVTDRAFLMPVNFCNYVLLYIALTTKHLPCFIATIIFLLFFQTCAVELNNVYF